MAIKGTNVENITVEPCNVSWGAGADQLDIGYIEGDIELSVEETGVDVTSHQTGTNKLDFIRTGKTASISLTMEEAIVAKLAKIVQAGGATSTPEAEVRKLTMLAAAALNSKYFTLPDALDAIVYKVWFNVNSLGVEPVVPGTTEVEVALATGATAAQAATAVAAALAALTTSFSSATASGADVLVTNADDGASSDPDPATSLITYSVILQGIGAFSGWGSTKDFNNTFKDSKKLALHPTAAADDDLTRDIAFWRAYPIIKSIKYSGEKPKTVSLEWKLFQDPGRQNAVNFFILGDHR